MRKQAEVVAACGVAAALGVVLMLLGSFLGLGMYVSPMLTGLCLAPIGRRWGTKYQLVLWVAVSLVCLMVVPDVEENLMFAGFFGWYPAARPKLERLPPVWRWPAKLAVFNGPVIALELLVVLALVPERIGLLSGLALLALGNAVFILYDKAIPHIEMLMSAYLKKLRPK